MAEKDKESGKGKIILPIIMLVLVLLITFIALVKLDIFGLGTKVIGPSIKNIPVINLILPKMPETVVATEVTPTGDGYQFNTVDEAVERLKATEIMLKEKEKEAETLNEQILLLNQEIERLKVFEDNQVQFEEDKKAFDQLVAENADPESYMAYVEKTYPEQALAIYQELIVKEEYNKQVDDLAKMYQEMDPESAALILEQTAAVNIEMVQEVLLKLDPVQAGDILAAMDPKVADKISRYIFPE